jgi:protein O-GlcNAc transferase
MSLNSDAAVADLLRQGMLKHREGGLAEAERFYRKALHREPKNPQALHLLGALEGQRGRLSVALDLMHQALAADPDNPHLRNNLGETLRHLGRNPEAIAMFHRAVQLDPTLLTAWVNAADAAKAEIARDEAAGHAERASLMRKETAQWLAALGIRYWRRGSAAQAETACRDAITLDADNASAHCELGLILRSSGRLTEAEAVLRRAIALQPDLAEAHNNLGTVLEDRGKIDAAQSAFRRALTLKPDFKEAADNLTTCTLHSLVFRAGVSPEAIFAAHREWGLQAVADRRRDPSPSFANSRDPNRRLRVGYLSPDLRRHSVSYFLEPLLASHDPAAVEIYCYANVQRPDETTRRFQALAAQWRSVVDLDDAAIGHRIGADGIDVVVELAGHTGGTRITALLPKPAPVTVNWLGYPATTGLPTIDYRITDAEADPPGVSDRLHTERLVRLPQGFLCYRPPGEAPRVAPSPALDQGFVTFGCFNNPKKITASGIETWAGILAAVPNARLLLKGAQFADGPIREDFEGEFAKHGISLERLDFRAWAASKADHLSAYAGVDIALDPFPYNGTTTTCEALWMGVPVVTLRGDHHAARVGASLLTRVGLEGLIAKASDEYIAIAVGLARNAERLQELRTGMRERMRMSPLMDEDGFARQFETALRDMWREWCKTAT